MSDPECEREYALAPSRNPLSEPVAFQAIQALCYLQERVAKEVFSYAYAADCFCGHGGFWPIRPGSYRNDFKAIDFIVAATERAIAALASSPPAAEKCSEQNPYCDGTDLLHGEWCKSPPADRPED